MSSLSNSMQTEKQQILSEWERDHTSLQTAHTQELERSKQLQDGIVQLEARQRDLLERERLIQHELTMAQQCSDAAWASAAQVSHDASAAAQQQTEAMAHAARHSEEM